ncbi:MAG TPA: OprD family outer membrane porin, partial [Bacteroidia bacterium]
DYYAWGNAAALWIISGEWEGFRLTAGGSAVYNTISSDLAKPDPLGGSASRYETELFEITDPANKDVLPRFENLSLNYRCKKFHLEAGRFAPVTPFINTQDGRLRPGITEGISFWMDRHNNFELSGGWIERISPRSTVKFYKVQNSIGIYPQGVTPYGKRSQYRNNLRSDGIFYLQAGYYFKYSQLKCSDFYADNIFNTAMLEWNAKIFPRITNAFTFDIFYVRQDAVNNGGNADPSKTYFTQGGRSNSGSVRLGFKESQFRIALAYSLITGDGRFLMPREWGAEPFYTFMQPERTEGCGNVQAISLQTKVREKKKLSYSAAVGYFKMPDVLDCRLNKYGLPSFYQLSTGLRYRIYREHSRFIVDALYIYKGGVGNTYDNYKYIENKVNMSHYNLILNYYFD